MVNQKYSVRLQKIQNYSLKKLKKSVFIKVYILCVDVVLLLCILLANPNKTSEEKKKKLNIIDFSI